MIVSVFLATALAVTSFTEQVYQNKFVEFMQAYKKSYTHDEFAARYAVFKANVDFVEQHNANPQKSYSVAMNEFGDLTAAEFARIYNGLKYTAVERAQVLPEELNVDVSALPTTVDWVKKGAVTGVKNQGQCGSCWSFSTTGSVEGQHFIKKQQSPKGMQQLVGLSEQNLMDCSSSYGNQACDGGLMDDAFEYIIANKGIELEVDYPYTAEDGYSCKYTVKYRGACIEAYHDIPSGDETALHTAIAQVGPVSVAIDASHSSFQFYNGGVYDEPNCSSTQLDHGVLAVGYGTDNGKQYYLVKNSWGTSWGLQGYIMMSAYKNNQCGIATAASYPTISKTVC